MSHQGKTFDQRLYLFPYLWKDRGIFGVLTGKAMHLTAPVVVVIGLGADEGVEGIYNLSVAYDDNAYGTNG